MAFFPIVAVRCTAIRLAVEHAILWKQDRDIAEAVKEKYVSYFQEGMHELLQ